MRSCSVGSPTDRRQVNRTLFGVEIFEDVTPSGFRIAYLVSEAERYVAVLRVRKET